MKINTQNVARLMTGKKYKNEKDVPDKISIEECKNKDLGRVISKQLNDDGNISKAEIQLVCDKIKKSIICHRLRCTGF